MDGGAEHLADVRPRFLLVHRANAEASRAANLSLPRLRSLVRRMGLRPGRHARIRSSRVAPRRIAFRQCRRPSRVFSVSAGHGAAPHACQSAQQPGACPHLRERLEGHQSLKLGRRNFLGLGSAALVGLSLKSERKIEGSFVNDSFQIGHLLRDRAGFPAAKRIERVPVVIVGGGIAGLSAAWRLRKRGFNDFVLLEMNAQPGGNARWGENEITAYPWAAHYVPVPGPRAVYVRELFEDLGVLKDGHWEERYLAFSPQERLFLYGRWQEGIEPAVGLKPKDRDQFQRLENLFAEYRKSGSFTVPLELGLSSKFHHLDRISFSDWLRGQGFDSRLLHWYMNYACRDDYGALARETSAWAGIHYFSSRESEEKGPLTWPEGTGWITRRLLERVGGNIRTSQMVHRIAQ